MNPYKIMIAEYEKMLKEGRNYPLGTFEFPQYPKLPADAPKVLIFAPHPDDETIVGGLALRLLRQSQYRIIDVPVTLGSNKARRQERLQELKNCCRYLGFEIKQIESDGLEKVNCSTRQNSTALWSEMVEKIARVLGEEKPNIIFFPHSEDWNSTHIGTHYLVTDALRLMPPDFSCFTVETEYWGAMDNPNLMIELDAETASDLLTALTFHVGEVKRNPYHLSFPAWLIDNTRRGAELVGGQGASAPNFTFSILYRVRLWQFHDWRKTFEGGKIVQANDNPATIFTT
jgi:LmbE family N-acetylglucosaminyl deacetylase